MGFVRARHEETGHLAALPEESLRLGMHPGWVKVDGPVPDGPKIAVLRPADNDGESAETKTGDGKKPPQETKTAGGKSAEKKE